MRMDELKTFGIPNGIVEIWKQEESQELLPIQEKSIHEGKIFEGDNLLIIAPTSSGKTFIGEMACCRKSLEDETTLFLVPYRAIAEEKFLDFKGKYEKYGIRVVISTGEHHEYDDNIKEGNFGIAIFTYEKCSSFLVTNPELIINCGLIVVDEVQMMMDSTRGSRLELLLTKVFQLKPSIQFIGLSAVLETLNDFDKWLKARVVQIRERPIELYDGIFTPSDGILHYKMWNSGKREKEVLIAIKETDKDVIVNKLVGHLVNKGEQVLIFRDTVNSTVDAAKKLVHVLSNLPASTDILRELNDFEDTAAKGDLQATLRNSVAFHNSDLTAEERLLVENGFRDGKIRVVCSTSTLAMGVNLPAYSVIIQDDTKWEFSRQFSRPIRVPLKVGEYRNMAGRAGRVRYHDDFGRSILIAQNQHEYDSLFVKYIIGPTEPFSSVLGDTHIEVLVLDLVASNLCKTEEEIRTFLFNTYSGFKKWTSSSAKQAVSKMISDAIEECSKLGLIERKNDIVGPTLLGKVCASKGTSLGTFDKLVNFVSNVTTVNTRINFLELLFCVALTDEARQVRFPLPREERQSAIYIKRLDEVLDELSIGISADEFLAERGLRRPLDYDDERSLKRALLMFEWIEGRSEGELEKGFNVRLGAIKNVAGNFTWLIDTVAAIAQVTFSSGSQAHSIQILSDRIFYGVKEEGLFLARLNVIGLGRGGVQRLIERGFLSEDRILDANISNFTGTISRTLALRLREEIEKNIDNKLERKKREHIRRIDACSGDSSLVKGLCEMKGEGLSRVVEDLFKPHFWKENKCERITKQNEGEPDLILYDSEDKPYVVSVTAKEKEEGQVRMKKAVEVIGQSARFKPVGYIVIGRPEFHELAIQNAKDQVRAGLNFKLITVTDLCEIYVLLIERKLFIDNIEHIFFNEAGIIDCTVISKHLAVQQNC